MKNILSVDVESWIHFYVDALKEDRSYTSLERKELDSGYIIEAVRDTLNLLKKYNQQATFFVLAEIFDWYPELVHEIAEHGHEIGYHTYDHSIVYTKDILLGQLELSTNFIDVFHPIGFRAPQINITEESLAHLKQQGFLYSSSTYDDGGVRTIAGIDEIPVSSFSFRSSVATEAELPKKLSLRMLTRQVPFGGGLSLALLGANISYFIKQFNDNGHPAVLFYHPWQTYDAEQIRNFRFCKNILRRFPLCLPYVRNIRNSIEKLLREHTFVSFKTYYYGQ